MLFLIIELFLVVCYAAGTYVNIYLRPVALATLLTLFLTDRRKAIFVNIVYLILDCLPGRMNPARHYLKLQRF
jgi:hypothetical protein